MEEAKPTAVAEPVTTTGPQYDDDIVKIRKMRKIHVSLVKYGYFATFEIHAKSIRFS